MCVSVCVCMRAGVYVCMYVYMFEDFGCALCAILLLSVFIFFAGY